MKTSIQKNTLATICIPTTRVNTSLKNCLLSLQNQKNRQFQIVIVTREKKLNEKRLEEQYALPITTVVQKKSGLVEAVNTAFRVTKTPIFIRIDDDVRVEPQWLEELLRPFQDRSVGAVTGPTIIPQENMHNRDVLYFVYKLNYSQNLLLWPIKKLYFSFLYENKLFKVAQFLKNGAFTLGSNFLYAIPKKIIEVTNIEACNFAVRTKILDKTNGFDTTFAKGLGDYHEADMAFKIRKSGYKIIYNPGATVYHCVEKSSRATRQDAYNRMLNFMKFYRRHFYIDSLKTLFGFILYLLFQNCYYVVNFMRSGDASQLKSIQGTLVGLTFFLKNEK